MEEQNAIGEPSGTPRNARHLWMYTACGAAGLLAGLVFRKDLNAEIGILSEFGLLNFWPHEEPTALESLMMFQDNALVGLTFFGMFNLVNFILVGIMLFGLHGLLKTRSKNDKIITTIALGGCLTAIALYAFTNQPFILLHLSNQYMSASTGAQRALLLFQAEAVINIETMLILPQGIGVYLSGLLFHCSNLLFGILLLRNELFGKKTAILGIIASSLMISYPIFLVIFPPLVTIPRVGSAPFLLAWHLLVGKQLLNHAGIKIQPKILVLLVIISFVGFFLSLILIGA